MQDSLLESRLNVHVANLAFCRYGRSLHYALFKDLLRKHPPKILVLEVREEESRSSHPDFPHIADMEDLLFPASFKSWLPQLVAGGQDRAAYQAKKWLGDLPDYDVSNKTLEHHYVPHPGKADTIALVKVKSKKAKKACNMNLEPPWVRLISKKIPSKNICPR